jgi:hypothetical protein
MTHIQFKRSSLAAVLTAAIVAPAHAAEPSIIISEVAPWASGNASYGADWFELTNTGASTVSIGEWRIDDNSNSFGSSVALRGIGSIGAGESVIFLEGNASGSTDATLNAGFVAAWFGGSAPAGLRIGNYGGSGVGLSTNGDAVNIFTAAGALVTRIGFPGSTTSIGLSFDNAAGLAGDVVVSQLSTVGVNGAFLSHDGTATGSPGSIGAVPEPETCALMLAGLLGLALVRRARA